MKIRNKVGTPVEGSDFFGRKKELKVAERHLDNEESLLLSAPRRVGKSSFAKKLISMKIEEGWHCVYIDLERVTTEEGFLQEISRALDDSQLLRERKDGDLQTFRKLLGIVNNVSFGKFSVNLNLKEEKENLYNTVTDLLRHEENSLIVMDELTLFLEVMIKSEAGRDKVTYIMNWLRSLRQVSQTKVRWLFCGSIGLKNFSAKYNLSYTINDLYDLELGEMSIQEAIQLLELLGDSNGMPLGEVISERILDKLHWNLPYFIQIMFAEISDAFDDTQVTTEMVDEAYTRLCSKDYLSTWSERLAEYSYLETTARKILKAVAQGGDGITRQQIINILMTGMSPERIDETEAQMDTTLKMLENDGYVMRTEEGKRVFRSPVLRDYWRHAFID